MNAVSFLFTSEPTKHPFKFTETGLDHGTDVLSITINYKTTTRLTFPLMSTTR